MKLKNVMSGTLTAITMACISTLLTQKCKKSKKKQYRLATMNNITVLR